MRPSVFILALPFVAALPHAPSTGPASLVKRISFGPDGIQHFSEQDVKSRIKWNWMDFQITSVDPEWTADKIQQVRDKITESSLDPAQKVEAIPVDQGPDPSVKQQNGPSTSGFQAEQQNGQVGSTQSTDGSQQPDSVSPPPSTEGSQAEQQNGQVPSTPSTNDPRPQDQNPNQDNEAGPQQKGDSEQAVSAPEGGANSEGQVGTKEYRDKVISLFLAARKKYNLVRIPQKWSDKAATAALKSTESCKQENDHRFVYNTGLVDTNSTDFNGTTFLDEWDPRAVEYTLYAGAADEEEEFYQRLEQWNSGNLGEVGCASHFCEIWRNEEGKMYRNAIVTICNYIKTNWIGRHNSAFGGN